MQGVVPARPPRKANQGRAPQAKGSADRGPVWEGEEYPRLDPGIYLVRGCKVQGPEWVRPYNRWSVRVEFHLMDEPCVISAFFNMGNDPDGPRVGRQSRYYKAWTLANDGPPQKGQLMDADVFMEKMMRVVVAYCVRNSEGRDKHDVEVYSRITEIHSLVTP